MSVLDHPVSFINHVLDDGTIIGQSPIRSGHPDCDYPELSDDASRWLITNGYDELMGARPMARVIQEHIKKGLADEVLFGKLKGGGHVRVVLVLDEAAVEPGAEKIGFEFVEGPVTPKPEKLPGARKRTPPRKPKPSGPSGGSKGPAPRGPLVKV